jgi:hypothetical protein
MYVFVQSNLKNKMSSFRSKWDELVSACLCFILVQVFGLFGLMLHLTLY